MSSGENVGSDYYQVVPGNEFFDNLGEYLDLKGDSPILAVMAGFFSDGGVNKETVATEWGEIYNLHFNAISY